MKISSYWLKIIVLLVLCALFSTLYLTYNTYGNFAFAFALRGKKILAFILVALATSVSTISFQTLTRNQFLTPGILGLDNFYILIQTLLFFFIGGVTMLSQESIWMFLANILLMSLFSVLFLLLMVVMVAGTLFSSLSTFLQVLMDPNEYDLLQGRLFASFGNVNHQHLLLSTVIILLATFHLWRVSPELNILLLGIDPAKNLGINIHLFQKKTLCSIVILTGTATALVGPTIFLGFIVATISYRLFYTYRHQQLFLGSFLIGVLLLISGQFLVEQVFQWKTTISVVIQFSGGIFFVGKIIAERKQT